MVSSIDLDSKRNSKMHSESQTGPGHPSVKRLSWEYNSDRSIRLPTPNYKSQITPLNPVAIRLGQTEVSAPEHETWEVLACSACKDKFALGPNQIFGSRITKEKATRMLLSRLADDHNHHRAHENSYELPD